MPTGKVKWFSLSKGYGFVTPDDGSPDIFLHLSQVQKANLPTLDSGRRLSYSVAERNGKIYAEGLALVTLAKESPATQPHTADDDAFEKEWGLRRS